MQSKTIISILSLAISLPACSGEPTASGAEDSQQSSSTFKNMCELSSGKVTVSGEEERCQCEGETCDAGLVCNVLTKKCPAAEMSSCNENEQFCRNGKAYECIDAKWIFKESCPDNLGCSLDNSICAECGIGDKKCDGMKLLKCSEDSQFVDDETCLLGCDEVAKACKKKCQEGEVLCVDGGLKTCSDEDYGEAVPCENGVSCAADNKSCGECTNGASRCVEDGEGFGQLESCKQGKWVTEQLCGVEGNRYSCDPEANSCGQCLNGKDRCENSDDNYGTLYTCEQGRISSAECRIDLYDSKAGTTRTGLQVSCMADGKSCGVCRTGMDICYPTSLSSAMYSCANGDLKKFLELCEKGCHATFNQCK